MELGLSFVCLIILHGFLEHQQSRRVSSFTVNIPGLESGALGLAGLGRGAGDTIFLLTSSVLHCIITTKVVDLLIAT
jgi:hypothetical protein